LIQQGQKILLTKSGTTSAPDPIMLRIKATVSTKVIIRPFLMASKNTSSTPANYEIAEAGPASPIAIEVCIHAFPIDSKSPEARPIQNNLLSKLFLDQ